MLLPVSVPPSIHGFLVSPLPLRGPPPLSALSSSPQGVSAGVLRGMGRQTRVALLNLGGFWVLGLPGGAILAFYFDLGVYGIWWGFVMVRGGEGGRKGGCVCLSVGF